VNLRELWDTVVLRDILGYIFPGAITLLAVALLLDGTGIVDLWGSIGVCSNRGLIGLLQLLWKNPLALWLLAPLSYSAGYLQSWVADELEGKCACSNLGRMALAYLTDEDNKRSYDYAAAALAVFGGPNGLLSGTGAGSPLEEWIHYTQAARCRQCASPPSADRYAPARDQAYELWRLCDYYLLEKAPDFHATYPGRYYVLTVLFTNLGLSAIFLGLSTLLSTVLGPAESAERIRAVLTVGALTWMAGLLAWWCQLEPPRWPTLGLRWLVALELCAVAVLLALSKDAWWLFARWGPVVVGLALLARSVNYRKNFVERVFPMFYALTQAQAEQDAQE
jgi:hypothetical protein